MKISKPIGAMLLSIMNQLTKRGPGENVAEEDVYTACENLKKILEHNLCNLPPVDLWNDDHESLTIGSKTDDQGMIKIEAVPDELVYSLSIQTKTGEIRAYTSGDRHYPGLYLCYEPDGVDTEIDLACAETHEGPDDPKPEGVDVYTWEDAHSEDWTNKFTIKNADVKSSIDEN